MCYIYNSSRQPRIETPLLQVQQPSSAEEPYNGSLTYVTFVIGDGDNINFVKGSRFDWMRARAAKCGSGGGGGCFPLAWTLSPQLLHLAPSWARWYYAQVSTA